MQPPVPIHDACPLQTSGPNLPDRWQRTHLRDLITRVETGTSVNSEDRPARPDEIGGLKVRRLQRAILTSRE